TLNAGVPLLCDGTVWASGTTRTTALERKSGLWTNAASMTCVNNATTVTVAQDAGTYLGTFRTTASTGTTTWVANPAAAAGGGNVQLYLWNQYNRVAVAAASKDSVDSWAYGTATWRAADAGATGSGLNNRVSAVFGNNEDSVAASYYGLASGNGIDLGVGLDSITAFSGTPWFIGAATGSSQPFLSGTASYAGQPGLGLHFFQAL